MAATTVTCFNDRNYRDNSILAIKDSRMLIGAEYAGDNYREYFGLMQFSIPALYDQNITSAKLYLYVLESRIKVTLEPQFYDIKEEVRINTYDSFMNNYGDKYVLSGPDTKTFESSSTIYNAWISLDITNLIVGNNNNPTFSIVLVDNEHNQWASGAGGVPTPYVAHVATIEEGHAPYIVINHENATPFKPTILYPDGDVVQNSGPVTFRWRYNAGVSAGQARYEFGWKMQSNTAWNATTVTSAAAQHTVDASTFVNGIAEWRVKTYNNIGLSSEYAYGQFYVVGKPGNPIITGIKNDALTEISWSAEKAEESSARVKILKDGKEIYDSGVISGGIEDIHKPNIILPNGVYAATLAIANIYDLWSDSIGKTFTINRTRPDVPELSVQGCGDHVRLDIKGNVNSYYIYRAEYGSDFIPIAYINPQFNSNGYIYDDFSVKADVLYKYYVRAYYDGGIADSQIKDVYIRYRGYYLSELSDMSKRINMYLSQEEGFLPISMTMSNENAYRDYIGRRYPVKETSMHARKSIASSFFIYAHQKQLLDEMMDRNGTYCLRGHDMMFYGDISSYAATNTFFNEGYAISITMEQLDHKEGISYV